MLVKLEYTFYTNNYIKQAAPVFNNPDTACYIHIQLSHIHPIPIIRIQDIKKRYNIPSQLLHRAVHILLHQVINHLQMVLTPHAYGNGAPPFPVSLGISPCHDADAFLQHAVAVIVAAVGKQPEMEPAVIIPVFQDGGVLIAVAALRKGEFP